MKNGPTLPFPAQNSFTANLQIILKEEEGLLHTFRQ